MADKIKVALVRNDRSAHTYALHHQLLVQSAVVSLMRSCDDLSAQISALDPPDLILTDLTLTDGTWEDVLRIAQKAPVPINVIVVSRLADIRLYVEALEKGAFDFITPPFEASELSHVLRTAFWNVATKREACSRASQLPESSRTLPTLLVTH